MEIIPCRFELPRNIKRFRPASKEAYGTYLIEPLPAGYGQTIGHALRQILCSASDGASFNLIDGLNGDNPFEDDWAAVIENLKQMRINLYVDGPLQLVLRARGPDELTVGDIQYDVRAEFINPDHYLATLKPGAEIHVTITVQRSSAADREAAGFFQPVRLVRYRCESRPTQNYAEGDRVIFQVWTDGGLSPDQAMTRAMQVLRQHYAIYGYPVRHVVFAETRSSASRVQSELMRKLAMSVNEIELSVRSANCLNNANIQTIGALVEKTEAELLQFRNFGRKSLHEIRGILVGMDLSLGMTISSPPADVSAPPWPEAALDSRLSQSVNELELSVRATNCLNSANIQTIGELAAKTEAELLKYRNFGRGSLAEIKQVLGDMGLSLGMENIDSIAVSGSTIV